MGIIHFKICYILKIELKTSSIKDVESIFHFLLIENGRVLILDKLTVQLLSKILTREALFVI